HLWTQRTERRKYAAISFQLSSRLPAFSLFLSRSSSASCGTRTSSLDGKGIIARPPPLASSPKKEDPRMLSRHSHTNKPAPALPRSFLSAKASHPPFRAEYRCSSR